MAETHLIITSLLFLFLFSPTSTLASHHHEPTVLSHTIEALSDSGFTSMAAALHHISRSLDFVSKTSPLTIFAPTDSAFRRSGHPDRNLLYYHLCPLKFPIQSVPTLPYGTKIPTYHYRTPLIATPSASFPQISINNVAVNRTAVFDSGPIVVYAIGRFFDPLFIPYPIPPPHKGSHEIDCAYLHRLAESDKLRRELRKNYYSETSGFLEWQFINPDDRHPRLTVFAPFVDKSITDQQLMDFREYGSFFRRHVVPCRLTWGELRDHRDSGVSLPTFLEGYTINVTGSGTNFVLNGVPLEIYDVYGTFYIAAHGLSKMLELRRTRNDLFTEFPAILADHKLKDGFIVGRLRDVTDSAASHVRREPNGTLTVTASDVGVDWREVDTIIFHGSLLVNNNDTKPSNDQDPPKKDCSNVMAHQFAEYRLASDALKAIGDSFMSSFLDMQLSPTGSKNSFTVLAPLEDRHNQPYWVHYYLQYPQHLIPCRVTWSDLLRAGEGAQFITLVQDYDFMVQVTKADNTVLLNKVAVIYPDLYVSDTLVVHGVKTNIEPDVSIYLDAIDSVSNTAATWEY